MPSVADIALAQRLQSRAERGLLRKLKLANGLVDFCSNDYLGLARTTEFKAVIADVYANNNHFTGGTGSRLLAGHSLQAQEAEAFIANTHSAEAALVFNSGYDANVGLFSCVAQAGDTILYDALIHASAHDGMRLSKATCLPFSHNNINELEDLLKTAKGNVFVAVESVYSMDGDLAPLTEIATLCHTYNAALIVDEAHALGVFGDSGLGLITPELATQCFARVYTYGKAMALHGAAVVGSQTLIDYLVNYARPFIYSTAQSPAYYSTLPIGYQHLAQAHQARTDLQKLIAQYKQGVQQLPYSILNSPSAIQCVVVPGNTSVRALASSLEAKGFDIRPIVAPTVPTGEERIRICLHSFNTPAEVDGLIKAFAG